MTLISDKQENVLRRGRRPAGDPWPSLIATAVFAVYAVLSVARYVIGNPNSPDLAIFTEAVKEYAHLHAPIVVAKGPGFDLLGDHFHPILALLAPAFRLFPSPVTLLLAQAALTALSVVPVYHAARHALAAGEARIVTVAYGLSWGLSQMVGYDFHEVCFAVPLIACSLSAMVRGKHRAAVWWALPLVFVKEDQGFTIAAIGLLLAVVSRRRLAGALLAAWGLGWSLLAVYVLIPALNPHHVYPYWVNGHGAGALWDAKAQLIVWILLPVAGVALRSPLVVASLPALLLRLDSSNSWDVSVGGWWSATAMPLVFLAAIDGLRRVRADRIDGRARPLALWLGSHAPAMMAAVAVALAFQTPLAGLWNPQTYQVPAHIRAGNVAQRLIPSGATVEATLGQLAPLAARCDARWWGQSAPQYILFDPAPGEWWEWKVPPTTITGRHPGVRYRPVFQRDGVWLFKRAG